VQIHCVQDGVVSCSSVVMCPLRQGFVVTKLLIFLVGMGVFLGMITHM